MLAGGMQAFGSAPIEITPERAAAMLAAGAPLIDVREPYEREAGHIGGSEHVELARLGDAAATLDRDAPVVFYCRVGGRSLMAAQAFRASGYEAYSLAGGLLALGRRRPPPRPRGRARRRSLSRRCRGRDPGDLGRVVGETDEAEVGGVDHPAPQRSRSQPREQPLPVLALAEDHREARDPWVWISASASNSSSRVPKPPGRTTNARAKRRNMILRTKKKLNLNSRSRYRFGPRSPNPIVSPTERPPASWAPRLTASIEPPPPPVITASPARANSRPSARARS